MKTSILFSLVAAAQMALAAPTNGTGYHIIVARAALELPGEGSTGFLANDIVKRVPNSDSVGLNYPALPLLTQLSIDAGVKQLHSDINSYVKTNPLAKIVLLGYDQGAEVVGDVLGGSLENGTDAISGASADAIKGIILLSDPSHVPGQSYDAGTATTAGTSPRGAASLANLARFSKIMKSYCDAGDTACASGTDASVNRGYLDKYQQAATDFIVGLYK